MHLREHLTRCSSSRQRVGVNLGVLISWHGVHVPYILSVMPSLSVLSLFVFPASAEILNGGVLVDQNKFLCHADTIHWQDIIKNPLAELLVVSSNSSNPGCEYKHTTPTPTCLPMPRVSHELFFPLKVLTRAYIILQMTSCCIHVFYNSISTWGHLQSIRQSVGFNLLPYMCQIFPFKPRPCIFPEPAVPVVRKIWCIPTLLSR